jgi:hypothetical protein
MNIYCCCCNKEVAARLTDGSEIYPHRRDLHFMPFWKCDQCGNYVGCHHKTKNRTRPLGYIPSPELKNARNHIHRLIDPVWKSKLCSRQMLYGKISKLLGYEYHTAEIKTIEEARKVYRVAREVISSIR